MGRTIIGGASDDLDRRVTDLLLENDIGHELTLVSRTLSKQQATSTSRRSIT